MAGLSDIPLTRPAATDHSPHRKPRAERQRPRATKIAKQEAFLSFIRAGESQDRAILRAGIKNVWVVYAWRNNPEFKAAHQEARRVAFEGIMGRLQGLLPRAADVAEAGLESSDEKHAWDVAKTLIKDVALPRDGGATAVEVKIAFVIGKGYVDVASRVMAGDGNGNAG